MGADRSDRGEMDLWYFAVLLLLTSGPAAAASALNSLGCVPEPASKDQAVKVFYTTSVVPTGCEAHGPIDPDLEVHVLNLRYSRSQQLLRWAKETYGGISSFAELEDPQRILFQVGRGPSANEDCTLAQNFNAESYLEVEVLSPKVETCLDSHKAPGNVAHILWLQQSSSGERMQTVEVNVKTVCKDGRPEYKAEMPLALWLKSHQNMLWKMGHGFSFVQLLASGKYSFATFSGVHNGRPFQTTRRD
ncbi:hypothetical protein E2320_006502 [Naja naja]|nr:hypothetical protein E2320_006502 [Naja naja]